MSMKARTGHTVDKSGQYRPAGGRTEYTFVEGHKVPPNNIGKRQYFVLVDPTRHKN